MSKFAKILVTIGVIILWFLLSVINTEMRKVSGHSTPGIFGMILLLGVIGAVRAIWKSKKMIMKKMKMVTIVLFYKNKS